MYVFKFFIFLNILIILQNNCYANFFNNLNIEKNEYNISNMPYIQENKNNICEDTITDTNFKYEKIIKTCEKISNTKSYNFEIYKTNNMKNMIINLYLHFIPSNTAIKNISSISIYCNNIPINSYTIDTINLYNKIEYTIDSKYIENGKNTISIKCNIKSSLNNLELNEEINWVVIEKCSKIEVTYDLSNIDFISNFYENTYYLNNDTSKTTLVVPNNLSSFDYTLMSTVSSLLGNYYKTFPGKFSLDVLNYKDLIFTNHSSIVIGTYNEIKNYFPFLDLKNYEEKKFKYLNYKNDIKNTNIGFITIQKIGDISHIFLIINNKEQLINFTNIFSNKILYEDLKIKNYILQDTLSKNFINKPIFNISGTIKNLGYNNEILKGNDHFSREYNFSILDKNLEINKNIFKFYFQYSEEILFENSYVTVYVNNEPIKTQKLTYKNSNKDKIIFSIPKNLQYNNKYNIKLFFYLEPINLYNNLADYNWVKIDVENSNYNIKFKKRKKISLFLSNSILENNIGEIEGTILTDNIKNLDKNFYSNFCSYLGKNSKKVNFLNLIESKTIPENFTGFILCKYNSNIIKDFNNYEMKEEKELGEIEILSDKNIVIIRGTDKNQLNLTIENYTKGFNKNDFKIITKNGKIIFKLDNDKNMNNNFLYKYIKNINKTDIGIIIYTIIIIILLIIIFIYIKRKNDR